MSSESIVQFALSLVPSVIDMEYQYSRVVDPSEYVTEGLCDGIPLRVHYNPDFEDIGAVRAQEDWSKHVAPVKNYKGGLGPEYSFMTVAVPECLPDRLELISYANELAFLHDGEGTHLIFRSARCLPFSRCHRSYWSIAGKI